MYYTVFRGIFRLIFTYLCRWEVSGRENIPREGGVIVIANHTSYWDPPVLGSALQRQVHFMAKAELFKIPVLNFFITRFGAFPVHRGRSDREAIRRSLNLLKEGKVVGIFPEGTRSLSGHLLPAQPGAALIALKSGVPIVPVAIIGARRIFSRGWFRRFRVKIGQPLTFPELYGKKLDAETLERVSQYMMDAIKKLIEDNKGA